MTNSYELDYRDPEWVAQRLGLDKNTVYKYLQDGTFPGLQLGRKWLVSERRLVEFLDDADRRQTRQRRNAASRHGAFNGFSEHAGAAMEAAREEALALNHGHIGTEHILLGLLSDRDNVACQALGDLGVDLAELAERARAVVQPGPAAISGDPALTPRAKKALKLAADEARLLEHDRVGTEHVLLAMLAAGEGMAHSLLTDAGVTDDSARAAVRRRLAG